MNRIDPIGQNKLKQLHEALLHSRQRRSASGGRKTPLDNYEACIVGCTADLQQGDTLLMPPRAICHNEQPNLITLAGDIDRLGLSTGIAFASAAQRNQRVVLSFLELDTARPAAPLLRFAQQHSLPIICVAITRAHRSPAKADELPPVIRVDANDVMAIYRVAYESIEKARRGAGPTWIECVAPPAAARTVSSRRRTTSPSSPNPHQSQKSCHGFLG